LTTSGNIAVIKNLVDQGLAGIITDRDEYIGYVEQSVFPKLGDEQMKNQWLIDISLLKEAFNDSPIKLRVGHRSKSLLGHSCLMNVWRRPGLQIRSGFAHDVFELPMRPCARLMLDSII
jgi:hypothetical protein